MFPASVGLSLPLFLALVNVLGLMLNALAQSDADFCFSALSNNSSVWLMVFS